MLAVRGKNISEAREALRRGELVAIPTETVYGLAANALDEDAVLRIFKAKNRPYFDPLIVHVASQEQALQYVEGESEEVLSKAGYLMKRYWPGPLTLLLKKSRQVPDLVSSGLPRVALRMPRHVLTLELLQGLSFPLAAPSANPFGYISPTRPEHVLQQLGDKIAYLLDGGPCEVGVESTILGFEGDEVVIHRKGGISVEELVELIGPVRVVQQSSSNPASPGMLKSHYAPCTPLYLGHLPHLLRQHAGSRIGVLAFRQILPELPADQQRVLSTKGDLAEAAKNLFAAMHELDAMGLDAVIAELLPEKGLGLAINDRLRRAAFRENPT